MAVHERWLERIAQPQEFVGANSAAGWAAAWSFGVAADQASGAPVSLTTDASFVAREDGLRLSVSGTSALNRAVLNCADADKPGAGDFTVAVKFRLITSNYCIVGRWNTGGSPATCDWLIGSNNPPYQMEFIVAVGATTYAATISGTYSTGEDYGLIARRRGTTITLDRYDYATGARSSASTTNAGITTINSNSARGLKLGEIDAGAGYNSSLESPYVGIANRALTDEEVTDWFANPSVMFEPERIWVPVSVGSGGGNLTLTGETSDLSLSGQSSFASTVLTGSNTDISLSGQSSTSLLSLSGTNGTLTLTPQDSNFSLGGNLTLTGEVSDLLLTGQTSTVLVSLVSSNTDLSLTSQTATSNLTVNTTNASLSLIGEDSNFVLVGDLILTGEVADLYLNGLDSQFVLSGAVKGGVSRNKQKKKKRRIQQQQDTSDLDSLVQELESEKQQLKEIKEEIKEELEEIAEEVKEEVQTLEKTEEKLDRLDILSMRIDAVNLAIGNINTQLAKVMTLVENSTSKVTKQIQNLEEVLIVLHEVANDDDD